MLELKIDITTFNVMYSHRDGKLLPEIPGSENVNRFPVIISCGHTEKLLQVPALASGTGRERASAVCNVIQEWGLQDKMNAIVFDTTSLNTSRINGTCTIMGNLLRKPLLWLACGNHLHEKNFEKCV